MNRRLGWEAASCVLVLVAVGCAAELPPAPADLWVERCGSVPCGGGRCVVTENGSTCMCDPGFVLDGTGGCVEEVVASACATSPCQEEGRRQCIEDGSGFRCECDPDRVEVQGACVALSVCLPNPCTAPFQSVCTITAEGPQCSCDPGHAPAEGGCDPVPVFDCAIVHTSGQPDMLEPNECPERASHLVAGYQEEDGVSINPAGDVDWFRIDTVAGRIYQVRGESHEGFELYVDLYASDGLTPLGADHRALPSFELSFKARATGPVYLRVRAFKNSAVGGYSIGISEVGPDDHPDTPEEARQIQPGSVITGASEFDGDADVFKVLLDGGISYRVSLQWVGTGNGVLELIGTDRTTIVQQRVGTGVELVTFSLATRWAYLRVRTDSPHALGTFALQILPLGPDDHADADGEATLKTPSLAPFTLEIERAGDSDVFTFQTTAQHVYFAKCAPVGFAPHVSLRLVDQAGVVLAEHTEVMTIDHSVGTTASVDGLLFLRVTASGLGGGPPPGTWKCFIQDLGPDDHGDHTGEPTALAPGTFTGKGRLELKEDVDVFSFNATAGHVYAFDCAFGVQSPCWVRVMDAGGAAVVSWSNPNWKSPSTGVWYLEVSGASQAALWYDYALIDLGPDDHGDDVASATPIAAGGQGAAALEHEADVDVFAFTAVAGHTYRFQCTKVSVTTCDVQLADQLGVVLRQGVNVLGKTVILHKFDTGGTYTFRVGNLQPMSTSRGTYGWSLTDLGVDDHGDSTLDATAVTLPMNGPMTATVDAFNDIDVFSVTATAGRVYRFTCVPLTLQGCVVHVLDPSGSVQALSHPGGASFLATSSAVWFFAVHPSSSSSSGTYSYMIEDLGPDDHGDHPGVATPLALGPGGVTALTEYMDDVDVFSVPVTKGNVYRLTCSFGSSSCYARVTTAQNVQVASTQYGVWAWRADESATVFVSAEIPNVVGTYTLRVEDMGPDDFGNIPAAATTVQLSGQAIAGHIQYPFDEDYVAVWLTPGSTYVVALTGPSPYLRVGAKDPSQSPISSSPWGLTITPTVDGWHYVHVYSMVLTTQPTPWSLTIQ